MVCRHELTRVIFLVAEARGSRRPKRVDWARTFACILCGSIVVVDRGDRIRVACDFDVSLV